MSWSARVWSSSAWRLIVLWVSISTSQASYAHATSGLRHFRSLVSDKVAHQIACSIVGSRFDYCNSLLLNCSNRNLDKLQRVQNYLARAVCNSSRLLPAEPLLRSLHWLPVRQRINYKSINSPISAIWQFLVINRSTLLIWYAHIVSRVCYDHQHKVSVVKVVLWSRGLTWRSQVDANPIPIPTPLIWRRKITLYRFNQGGAHTIAGGSNGSRGAEPSRAPLTLTAVNMILLGWQKFLMPEV